MSAAEMWHSDKGMLRVDGFLPIDRALLRVDGFLPIDGALLESHRPGKRPLSSSSPVIIVGKASGKVRMVAGASGGTRITTATAQALLNVLAFGMGAEDAVAIPRVHHQLVPDYIRGETDFAQQVQDGLRLLGHYWHDTGHNAVVQAVVVSPDGTITAAADPRKGGSAAGF